jgi:hypothetical protein
MTAMSAAKRAVAASSVNVMLKFVPAGAVGNMMAPVNDMASRPRPGASNNKTSEMTHAVD